MIDPARERYYRLGFVSTLPLMIAALIAEDIPRRKPPSLIVWIIVLAIIAISSVASLLDDDNELAENLALSSVACLIASQIIRDIQFGRYFEDLFLWIHAAIMWSKFSGYVVRRRVRKVSSS